MTFCRPFVKENEASSTFSNISEAYKSNYITYAGMVENLDSFECPSEEKSKSVIRHLVMICLINLMLLKSRVGDIGNTLFDLIGIIIDVALFCMIRKISL